MSESLSFGFMLMGFTAGPLRLILSTLFFGLYLLSLCTMFVFGMLIIIRWRKKKVVVNIATNIFLIICGN